jgi:hypothetical protein
VWAELDELEWYSFTCWWCRDEVHVSRSPDQAAADFTAMCELLYGDSPLCDRCRPEARLEAG